VRSGQSRHSEVKVLLGGGGGNEGTRGHLSFELVDGIIRLHLVSFCAIFRNDTDNLIVADDDDEDEDEEDEDEDEDDEQDVRSAEKTGCLGYWTSVPSCMLLKYTHTHDTLGI